MRSGTVHVLAALLEDRLLRGRLCRASRARLTVAGAPVRPWGKSGTGARTEAGEARAHLWGERNGLFSGGGRLAAQPRLERSDIVRRSLALVVRGHIVRVFRVPARASCAAVY